MQIRVQPSEGMNTILCCLRGLFFMEVETSTLGLKLPHNLLENIY